MELEHRGVPKILYDCRAAGGRPANWVFVVEGEKDVGRSSDWWRQRPTRQRPAMEPELSDDSAALEGGGCASWRITTNRAAHAADAAARFEGGHRSTHFGAGMAKTLLTG